MLVRLGTVASVAFFLLIASSAFAQTSLVGGTLEGSVTDSTGGRIAGAAVTAHELASGFVRQLSTGAVGAFRIPELPAGTYELSVSQPGFAPYKHSGVTLTLGSTVRLEIVLQPGTIATQVTVTAQPPAIDPAQTSLRSAVDKERIEELPVESRNYLNFVLLAPGVAGSSQQPGKRSLAPLPDSGFSFGGLRGRSNNVTIDGLDNNDEYVGSSRTELSLETVQEFQVVNAGLSAETGGASGGSINVITRTGANAIHGDAFVFLQNGSLDARNPFEAERLAPQLHSYRAGTSQGGPIIKDRTFYHVAFEQEHSRSLEDSFIDPAAAAAINRALASFAVSFSPTRQLSDNPFPVARVETEASAKLNHQLTQRNSLMLRYAFTNNREAGDAFNTSGLADPSARGSSFIQDHAIVGAFTSVINPQSVGDLRFQFAHRRVVLRTNDATGPGFEIAGLADFGRPYDGNGRRTETHGQLSYTFLHDAGQHLWKFGATVNRVQEAAALADGFGGLYLFSGLSNFAAGHPDQYRQAFGAIDTDFAVASYGAFVQDHWSITRKLTVDLGLRYDFEHLPNLFRQDTNNLSPRVGLAYQITPTWVVRSGYGIFFDRYVLASLNRVVQKNGAKGFEQVLDGDAAAALFQGPAIRFFPPWPPDRFYDPTAFFLPLGKSIYTADPGLATPYSEQASFTVEHLLARDLSAAASYLFVRGLKLSRTRNINLLPPGPSLAPGRSQGPTPPPVFASGRANPRFNDIFQLEDSASSAYQGASFTLNRRMSDELEFSASYTLSKTFDNASDFDEQPQNPFNLAAEWALSRQDQRHRLVFNALWELPIGDEEVGIGDKEVGTGQARQQARPQGLLTRIFRHLEVAPIFTVESGRPVDPLTGFDNGSHAFPLSARPPGFARNSLKTPTITVMDFRLLKYFPFGKTAHLDLVAEAFNLFNRTNVAQINPVFGAAAVPQPGFQQPITGTGARQIQFSIDFEF